MEKDAIHVKVALSDLSRWLGDPVSEKEIKNRQKLLRNLRVSHSFDGIVIHHLKKYY